MNQEEFVFIARGRVIQKRPMNSGPTYVVDMGHGYSVLAWDGSMQRRKHGEIVSVRLSDKKEPAII